MTTYWQDEAKKNKGDMFLGILAAQEASENVPNYTNRHKIPEAYLELCDWFVEATGLEPDGKVFTDWLDTFSYWVSKGLTKDDLQIALNDRRNKGEFVFRPGTLTLTAVAAKAQRRPVQAKPVTAAKIAEKEIRAVPMPDSVRKEHEKRMAKKREQEQS